MLMIVIETETEIEREKATGKILIIAIFQNHGHYHNTFNGDNYNSHDNNTLTVTIIIAMTIILMMMTMTIRIWTIIIWTTRVISSAVSEAIHYLFLAIYCLIRYSMVSSLPSTVTFFHLMLPQYLVLYHFNFDFLLSLWLYFLNLSNYL